MVLRELHGYDLKRLKGCLVWKIIDYAEETGKMTSDQTRWHIRGIQEMGEKHWTWFNVLPGSDTDSNDGGVKWEGQGDRSEQVREKVAEKTDVQKLMSILDKQYNVGEHEGSRGGIETTSLKPVPPNTQNNTLSQFTQLPLRNPSARPQSQPRPPQHIFDDHKAYSNHYVKVITASPTSSREKRFAPVKVTVPATAYRNKNLPPHMRPSPLSTKINMEAKKPNVEIKPCDPAILQGRTIYEILPDYQRITREFIDETYPLMSDEELLDLPSSLRVKGDLDQARVLWAFLTGSLSPGVAGQAMMRVMYHDVRSNSDSTVVSTLGLAAHGLLHGASVRDPLNTNWVELMSRVLDHPVGEVDELFYLE
ncbi:hypothetical protein ACHAO8_004934 [Botrytis cinerea]